MTSNTIIYTDLSTYTLKQTMAFYEAVFDWKYYGDNAYYLAYKGFKPVAGLYETPEKFKQMRMPHFWMTYIQVKSLKETVPKARKLGGIIEMVDEDNPIGKVALIRDPQGAGFTIYEGDQLQATRTQNEHGTLINNELHISNAAAIIPFYEGIFNWNFVENNPHYYKIYNSNKEQVATALQISNAYKGKYEYWICTFAVKQLQKTRDKIVNNGGSILTDEGSRILVTDHSGEAFFYITETSP